MLSGNPTTTILSGASVATQIEIVKFDTLKGNKWLYICQNKTCDFL